MVLLTSVPLPGLQQGLAAREGPCSMESDDAWSFSSKGWWGWRRPTTHPGTSIALTIQELSAVGWGCSGFGPSLLVGGLQVAPNFYIGFRDSSAGR